MVHIGCFFDSLSVVTLGDFALLLKAGMATRQALLYNGLSSLLCLLGMLVGLGVGNVQSANSWVFAGAAGMFIYIALVDMVSRCSFQCCSPKLWAPSIHRLFLSYHGGLINDLNK